MPSRGCLVTRGSTIPEYGTEPWKHPTVNDVAESPRMTFGGPFLDDGRLWRGTVVGQLPPGTAANAQDMYRNLDTMRSEIQAYLESHGIGVFHGYPRGGEHTSAVYWDVDEHPEYQGFLAAAEKAGVRLVSLYANQFSDAHIDDAIDRLEESALPRENRRSLEARLREMGVYAGFICQIELSFDFSPRVYIFDLHTEWFNDFNEILDLIEEAYEEDEDQEPLGGGYFSKN